MTNDESRYFQDRLDDLRKLRDFYKSEDVNKNINDLDLNEKDIISKDDVYKELDDVTSSLTRKNSDYLYNIKNELTNILYKIEEVIYEFHDLMWIANTPMDKFIENYLIKRNKICNLKNIFLLTKQLPSTCMNKEEIKRKCYSITDFNINEFKNNEINNEEVIININPSNIDHLDEKFLNKYILNYNSENNDDEITYNLEHNHILIDSERELDIYNITSELITIKDFIKVSVNTNDQLPFKVLLLFCNALILIGEYFWTTILKDKMNL